MTDTEDEPSTDRNRTYCAHCGKLLNDHEYTVGHLVSVHEVGREDAEDAADNIDWEAQDTTGGASAE